jgi:hypothetical protein
MLPKVLVRRLAPGRAHLGNGCVRYACKQAFVVRECERRFAGPWTECIEQRVRRVRHTVDCIAGGGKILEQRDHARRDIEPDRVTGATRRAGIIRHQDGNAPFGARQRA